MKPDTSGTSDGGSLSLPADVRQAARLRSRVIMWSHLDPALSDELGRFLCCRTFGPFLMLPCFWPHLLCVWPCLCGMKAASRNEAVSQYWILTETELKIVTMDHDATCCPGCCRTGDQVKTVPLENITDVGVDARGSGMANSCAGDLPSIYVDTASSGKAVNNKGTTHEAVGLGLAQYEQLVTAILDQRDMVKNGEVTVNNTSSVYSSMVGSGVSPVAEAEVMVRPAEKSAEERLGELKNLLSKGLITQDEFNTQRQAIISSI